MEHVRGLQVVNGNEQVRDQLWRPHIDGAVCLPNYATFHIDASNVDDLQPPLPPHPSDEPPAPQLNYTLLADLKTPDDEDEFKSAICRALSRARAHVSVENHERGWPHVHMLITLPRRSSDDFFV